MHGMNAAKLAVVTFVGSFVLLASGCAPPGKTVPPKYFHGKTEACWRALGCTLTGNSLSCPGEVVIDGGVSVVNGVTIETPSECR